MTNFVGNFQNMKTKITPKEFEQEGRVELRDTKTDTRIPAIVLIRGKWKDESFFMGFQDAFVKIAKMRMGKERKIGAEAKNVLLFLLGKIDYDNKVAISQIEIARELEMKRQNVSRAIKALIDARVLEVMDPQRKRRQRLRVNDEYAWRGNLQTLRMLRKDRKKNASKKT
jgi:hypothetical protein